MTEEQKEALKAIMELMIAIKDIVETDREMALTMIDIATRVCQLKIESLDDSELYERIVSEFGREKMVEISMLLP